MEAIRPATEGDLARCAELVSWAIETSTPKRGGGELARLGILAGTAVPDDVGSPSALVARWSADAEDELAVLLVGTIDGVVVGVAAGTRDPSAGRSGRIECCYVEPEAREVGVGGHLVEALMSWFGSHDCSDVDALALPGDRSTKQLLEASGFKTRLLVLHRSTS
ncbi:MAG TPA: GNAT family N-acetyltransferase [Acidimicrobiales bacterium]